MNPQNVYLVFRKELLDSLRDRRTLISMIVVPVLVMPVLIIGFVLMTTKAVKEASKRTPKVMLLGGEDSPRVTAALKAVEKLEWVETSPDYTNQISNKKLRAAVRIPEGFDDKVAQGDDATIHIFHYEGEIKSSFASGALNTFFRDYRGDVLSQRLKDKNLPETFTKPFNIQRLNVAPPKKVAGNMFGGMLLYIVLLMCMIGGMYPAMDLTAGEKERGTMETILTSPVPRTDLVLGKFLMVISAALITALLSLGSLTGSYLFMSKSIGGMMEGASKGSGMALSLDPMSVLAVFGMILPLVFFLSTLQLAISLYARSFKEAQTYLSPLMIAVIIPAMASMTPGLEMTWNMAMIPILNTSLVCRDILSGTSGGIYVIVIFFSNCVYALVALLVAVRLFHREEVLLRS